MEKKKIQLWPDVGDVLFKFDFLSHSPGSLKKFNAREYTIAISQNWFNLYAGLVPNNSFDLWGEGTSLQFWRMFIETEKHAVEEIYKDLHEIYVIEYIPTKVPEKFKAELKDLVNTQNNWLKELEQVYG